MSTIDLNLVTDSIKKSGFVLEHNVTDLLKSHKWTVISNRYYIDDVQESAREIDLIAYRTAKYENVSIYTTLIVSCKKNESNAWGLLLRDHVKNDPNIDLYPMKVWSNDKRLKYIVDNKWRDSFLRRAKDVGLYGNLFEPSGQLFAFQEIDKTKCTIQNDKNIFNAISSLMKAEAYEMDSLERRKNDLAIYNFNLISVLDSELVKIHFKGKTISPSAIDDAKCVFSYIVNRKETSSRIHFCTYFALEKILSYYDKLYELNNEFFSENLALFYKDIFEDHKRIEILKDDFQEKVLWWYNYFAGKQFGFDKKWVKVDLTLYDKPNKVSVDLDATSDEIAFLNGHKEIKDLTRRAFEKVYKYTGGFVFDIGIPF